MPFDHALRFLLTNAGFFLPGEAQKINRVTQAFAKSYYEDNKALGPEAGSERSAGGGGGYNPRSFRPSSPDVVEVLTFSLIMLHTDAHNPSVKKERKMTLPQFIANNRWVQGVVCGLMRSY
jgi:brefeldin A-inhibited guanine nucleotide-exchange protein